MPTIVDEQAIVDSLRLVPVERWGEVLGFLEALHDPGSAIRTGADLIRSGLVGSWAERDDVKGSREFAFQLRRQAESRRGAVDAAGH